ncbi:hypothetical protein PENSPDRAFT_593008 [Peniophora sp. CONT]|nr:hypothetical protein PENSPDRAFT_593008 [Peniophora sp. CONT]
MPDNSHHGSYQYKSSGMNSQGNHYCARSYDNGGSGYHYSNSDGSYHYSNPNGSTYHNNGKGSSTYTAPNGHVHKSSSK